LPGADQSGALSADQAQSLSATVQHNVTYMIQNCKLEPEPDKDPASQAGVPQLMVVLHDYAASFDHPAWKQ